MNRTAVNRLPMIVKFTAKDGKTNYQVLEKLPKLYFNIALSLSVPSEITSICINDKNKNA